APRSHAASPASSQARVNACHGESSNETETISAQAIRYEARRKSRTWLSRSEAARAADVAPTASRATMKMTVDDELRPQAPARPGGWSAPGGGMRRHYPAGCCRQCDTRPAQQP